MADSDIDQDELAASWGADLDDDDGGSGGLNNGEIASQWANMIDGALPAAANGNERILNQDEIDSLLGFDLDAAGEAATSGIRAMINSAMVSYERLPMLEIVFDRLVRLLTTSLRNFTSDNVEVSLDNISTIRFGDYLNSIPLPAMISVFKAEQWDNSALLTIDSNLIYAIVDVLLGGRGSAPVRIEGRPYTTIETALVSQMVDVILKDAESAFEPLSPVKFLLERLETNPRFAAIARPANAAILVRFRIDMEDRGGRVEMLIPFATLEPIRELLLQGFMGEKFGRDNIWESHLATEIWQTEITIDCMLNPVEVSLRKVMALTVGDTLMLDCTPADPVSLYCGGIPLSRGQMGRIGEHIAVRLAHGLDEQPPVDRGKPERGAFVAGAGA